MNAFDARLFLLLHHALSAGVWLVPMAVLSAVGGGWGSVFVIPLVASRRTRQIGMSLGLALAATGALVFVLKRIVSRVRPCACLTDVRALVFDAPTDFSFPSGHAAGSFAFCVFLAMVLVRTAPSSSDGVGRQRQLRFAGAAALVLVAVGVGLSRIALGVHYPGDVLAGALVGTATATLGVNSYLAAARRNP